MMDEPVIYTLDFAHINRLKAKLDSLRPLPQAVV